jgi:hypothetical protein
MIVYFLILERICYVASTVGIRSSRASALLRFLLFPIRSGNRVAESRSQGELREALCSHLDRHA